jgi:alanyl-tRNA synthetase
VIADHLRTSGFLVADGVLPANEGRGYVLRRIMRRAMRHAHLLGAKDPLMQRLVPSLVAEMGGAFPELVRAQAAIEATLLQEETQFRRTLTNGLRLLDDATSKMASGDTLPGDVAFKLYDTYGFPYDLTEDALRVQGLGVDRAGFDEGMARQKAMARAAWKGSGQQASSEIWFDIADELGGTEFTGYVADEGDGQIVALVRDGQRVETAIAGESVTILTNQTPFYGESGGQMGDSGTMSGDNGLQIMVEDTAKPLGRLHAHQARLEAGSIKVGDMVHMAINRVQRDQIRANHSATHLLHAALRIQLGEHVTQKGSLVAADRFRFDFSHNSALSAEDIAVIERIVNAQIRGNVSVSTRLMTPDDAIAAGAMALFGEKYGDEVRVLSMGSDAYSVELCGGTHVNALGDIALFKIISEGAVASGVRRVEALTGEAARLWLVERDEMLKGVAATFKTSVDDVPTRLAALVEDRKRLERELAEAKKALAMGSGGAGSEAEAEDIGGITFIGQIIEGLDPKDLRGIIDQAKAKLGEGVAAMITVNDGKASVAVGVTAALQGKIDPVVLVRAAVAALGGQGGGGRPDMAQGGGPDGSKAGEALDSIRAALAG